MKKMGVSVSVSENMTLQFVLKRRCDQKTIYWNGYDKRIPNNFEIPNS